MKLCFLPLRILVILQFALPMMLAIPQSAFAADPLNKKSSRPNILFIAIDDMNDWTTLFDENNPIQTPNLKHLADRGCFFTQAYCASPGCNPSRTAILTGYRPTTSGVYGNPESWRLKVPDVLTLPQYFERKGGYATRGAGKIFHHGKSGAGREGNPDFQQFFKKLDIRGPGVNKNYNGYKRPANRRLGNVSFDWGQHDQKMIDVDMCEWVEARMEEEWDKPLFLAAGIFNPHLPFYAPKENFSRYPLDNVRMPEMPKDDLSDVGEIAKRMVRKEFWVYDNTSAAEPGSSGSLKKMVQCYQAAADFADQMVGRLIDKLDETGMSENTIIVLWSDHGYHLGDKECCVKFTLWEKANHVPFIIVAPGVTKPGSRCDRPVGLVDIYPTLLELTGLPAKEDNDGISLVPLLKDPNRDWERPALMTEGRGNHAVRSKDWRYIRYSDGVEELYDQRRDPWNHQNLAGDLQHANVIAEHRKWLPKKEAPGKGMDHLYQPVPPPGAGLPGSGFAKGRTARGNTKKQLGNGIQRNEDLQKGRSKARELPGKQHNKPTRVLPNEQGAETSNNGERPDIVSGSNERGVAEAGQRYLKRDGFPVRDPFVYADSKTQTYYLYVQSGKRKDSGFFGVEAYASKDLENWLPPEPVLRLPENLGIKSVWAPEVHQHEGAFYLFVTLTFNERIQGPRIKPNAKWPRPLRRGTFVYRADSPVGPFKPLGKNSHTPPDWMAIDGTPFVEDGTPYMVFGHEWIQVVDGTINYVPMSDDWSRTIGKPEVMFSASDAIGKEGESKTRKIAHGCFAYRSEPNGNLYLIWASVLPDKGHCILASRSESGRIKGPWKHQVILEKKGGHGSFFTTFDNQLLMALHQPTKLGYERLQLYTVEEDRDGLTVQSVGRR